jgi:hypothetical protein
MATANADSFHPDDRGNIFLQNIGSYQSHTVSPQKTAFFNERHVRMVNNLNETKGRYF